MSRLRHLMAWLSPYRDPAAAVRRLDAAVSGAIGASEDAGRAARALSVSTTRVKARAQEIEQGARRRLQEQEARRSRADPRIEAARDALRLLERH